MSTISDWQAWASGPKPAQAGPHKPRPSRPELCKARPSRALKSGLGESFEVSRKANSAVPAPFGHSTPFPTPSHFLLLLGQRRRPETCHCKPPLDFTPEEYLRANRQFESAQDCPCNLSRTAMWFGMEPDVEGNILLWDRDIPMDTIYMGLASWDERQHINDMSGKLKAALIHVIAEAMFRGHLHPYRITHLQIKYLLERSLAKLKSDSSSLVASLGEPKKAHWLLGTMRSREELEWLKYQVERRWWIMMGKTLEIIERSRGLPADNELLDQYICSEAYSDY
ncbi:hypothetical protein M422DRAFT_274787 [Sphaerobolus stellatus SS14]|uniref:Uncharacterized protein n=1 Tax=Sphaerobolus stellatus (strain SS14) TaxID=990650 RepID=A0A0C9TRE5_SPHS4|nr:hypothetical protein M422DRAFT_274787 [Sphaerobolus stellatus SS14]